MDEPKYAVGDLGGGNYAEILGVRFAVVETRWGKMLDQNGELAGIVLEFWPPPLPWFKMKIPFTSAAAERFLSDAASVLNDE